MSKISLKHSGGNVVSLNSPTSAPTSADVAFKLPNADGSAGQFMKTDGSGNLAFATVADTNDYVKLQQATGSSGGSQISFDNLDVATYKFFDLMAFFQPVTDAQSLRMFFRTGGASGSNVTTNAYAYGFNVKKEANTSNCVASSPDNKMLLTNTVGNANGEGVFINIRISLARSSDGTSTKYMASNAVWDSNHREQGNAARMINGQGHFYDNVTYPTGFGFWFGSGDISEYSYTLYGIKG